VCDFYCGNGFIGSLLAREGLAVTGMRRNCDKPNQIQAFYDNACYQFSDDDLSKLQCDAVFASWIPPGVNPTSTIVNADPKIIVYVYTDHVDEQTGKRQCGTDDMFDELKHGYALFDEWSVTRPENLLHEIWPDLTPNIEETRTTRVYLRHDIDAPSKPDAVPQLNPYPWESDLSMALLALRAKQALQNRGFMVE
jgi:hypothetical protein